MEPDAAHGGLYVPSSRGKGNGPSKVVNPGTASFAFEIPGIGDTTHKVKQLTDALHAFKSALSGMSSSFLSGSFTNVVAQISRASATATQNLTNLSAAARGVGGGGGGGGGGYGGGRGGGYGGFVPSSSTNAGFAARWAQAAGSQTVGGSVGGNTASSMGTSIGKAIDSVTHDVIRNLPIIGGMAGGVLDFAGDMAMFPLRFARERINTNRNSSLRMAQDLTPYQWQGGADAGMQAIINTLKNIPGNMKGDVTDILNALTVGRQSGAMAPLGGNLGQDKAAQFYNMIGQFQMITPGKGAGEVAKTVGGQLSNTQSNQAAAFYTSGAFSLLKMGGGMKTASEWAQGIMNWLKGQRPGGDRGKNFSYGELLAQNFPGSNINAWFDQTGVSVEMRDYWWSWALASANNGLSGDAIFTRMGSADGKLENNQAWRKAAATTALTRNEFGLAGQMTNQYANRERSNQWFNQAMGAAVNRLVPGMAKGVLGMIQYMPDEVEQFLWNLLESSGPLGQIVGGSIGWTAAATAPGVSVWTQGGPGGSGGPIVPNTDGTSSAPLGDIGDYGAYGGVSTAGLHPDMRRKVERMMRDNPRLKVTSGLRDGYTQAKLQKKGIGTFGSGSPFIGDIGNMGVNGHSHHSAGWAADLGPRSEYGWLAANAHKYGLETGGRHGEPWHVQAAGTVGGYSKRRRRGVGDIGEPDVGGLGGILSGIGGAISDTISAIPVIGTAWDMAGGLMDGIEMLAKTLGVMFKGIQKLVDMSTGGGLLDMTNADPSQVATKSQQYMSLMGLGAGANATPDTVLPDNPAFAKGLPTQLDLSNSWEGRSASSGFSAGGAAGSAGPASVQRILQKYAGGKTTVHEKSVDAATRQRMGVALQAAQAAGFSGDELVALVSLAGRESNFRPEVYNGNLGTGDNSYGLWQINTLGGAWDRMKGPLGLTDKNQLRDPMVNARAAKFLFDQSNTPFYAWGPYRGDPPLHGGAEDWVPAVYSVAKADGYVGDLGDLGDYSQRGSAGNQVSIQFNNQFHLNTQGMTGGMDIGRLVPIMADRLEEEMRKRLAVRR